MVRHDLFAYIIGQCRSGAMQEELSEHLNACVQSARESGKVATLQLTLKIKPQGHTGQYHIQDAIKSTLPEMDKGVSIFFGTPEGNLQRSDPNQPSLDLQEVPDDRPSEYKSV